MPNRPDYAANYHTVGAGLKPALSLPWDANPVTHVYGRIMAALLDAMTMPYRPDNAANYHTVGAGLKPALSLPWDANPVTHIWPHYDSLGIRCHDYAKSVLTTPRITIP